jgi:hypothetical protein
MTLVGETGVSGEPGEIALAVGEPLERGAGAQSLSMRRNRMAGAGAEDAAEMVRRHREEPAQSNQGQVRVDAQRLPGVVDERFARSRRPGATRGDPVLVELLEERLGEADRAVGEIGRILSGPCLGDQGAVLDVESRGRRNRSRRQPRLATPDGGDQLLVEEDRRAVVAFAMGVVVALLDAGVHAVGKRGIKGRLGAVGVAGEAPAPDEHDGVAPVVKLDPPPPATVAAAHVLDLETLMPENCVRAEHLPSLLSSNKVQDAEGGRGQALRPCIRTEARSNRVASIRREIIVDVPIDEVWDAVRDYGALHERLAAGFATDTQLDGDDRIVTFFNGTSVRERLISLSDEERRLVWTIVDGPWTHHNGSVELHVADDNRTRFVWTTDILPDETVATTEPMVDQAMEAIRETLTKGVVGQR